MYRLQVEDGELLIPDDIWEADPLVQIRVNLNRPVRSEQKAETNEVLAAVDEDRKFVYQATIVRLMKARKVSLLRIRRGNGLTEYPF